MVLFNEGHFIITLLIIFRQKLWLYYEKYIIISLSGDIHHYGLWSEL